MRQLKWHLAADECTASAIMFGEHGEFIPWARGGHYDALHKIKLTQKADRRSIRDFVASPLLQMRYD